MNAFFQTIANGNVCLWSTVRTHSMIFTNFSVGLLFDARLEFSWNSGLRFYPGSKSATAGLDMKRSVV